MVQVNDLERQALQLEEVKAEILKIGMQLLYSGRICDQLIGCLSIPGRRAIAITADVTSEPDVERLVQTTVEHFGELNVCRKYHIGMIALGVKVMI